MGNGSIINKILKAYFNNSFIINIIINVDLLDHESNHRTSHVLEFAAEKFTVSFLFFE